MKRLTAMLTTTCANPWKYGSMFVLAKAVKVMEEHKTKNKYFKPRWITVGWSFCGIFYSIEAAMAAQIEYLESLAPAHKENPPELIIKEVPIGSYFIL